MVVALGNTFMSANAQEPVFPDSFDMTISCKDLNVSSSEDYDGITYMIDGECTEDQFSVTFAVPEGWDGFVNLNYDDFDPEIEPAYTKVAPYEDDFEWMPMEYAGLMGLKQGNTLVFNVDGEEHLGVLYLYWNEMVYSKVIYVNVNVTKKEASAEPVFPDSFDVTLEPQNLTLEQGFDFGVYTIAVSGECAQEQFSVTVAVPEGWDGFVGLTENDYDSEVEPAYTKAAPREEETNWMPLEMAYEYGLKKTNTLVFNVDGEPHYGQFYLYKDEMVDLTSIILVETNVTKKSSGIEAVITDGDTPRYYNMYGTEIATPKNGIFLKVVNGKASKVVVR